MAGDETATIERLVTLDDGEYGEQVNYRLADFVELPGEPDGEADVEGLARAGPHLWAVGSHSLERKKIEDKHEGDQAFTRGGGRSAVRPTAGCSYACPWTMTRTDCRHPCAGLAGAVSG